MMAERSLILSEGLEWKLMAGNSSPSGTSLILQTTTFVLKALEAVVSFREAILIVKRSTNKIGRGRERPITWLREEDVAERGILLPKPPPCICGHHEYRYKTNVDWYRIMARCVRCYYLRTYNIHKDEWSSGHS